jgi:signal transduction histidine kinase
VTHHAADRIGPAGTAVMAADGRVLLHTPQFADLVGRAGEDLRGQTLPPLLDSLLEVPFDAATPPTLTHGCGTGGRRITIVTERLPGGQFCLSAADVTGATVASEALQKARRAAETANSAKSRVLATISHELRTPLNAVLGFSDALVQTQPGGAPIPPERVREYATAIREAGLVLLRQINNILDVVRLESGAIALATDVIELPRLLEAAVRLAEPAARTAQVELHACAHDVQRWLRGDERRLRQVLAHLLANALRFTPQAGSVSVACRLESDGDVSISVHDSGIGISDADLQRALDPFGGTDPTAAPRPPGAGFGLYFARAVVEAHGGQVIIASRPGKGTDVTLRLPRVRLIEPTHLPGQPQDHP